MKLKILLNNLVPVSDVRYKYCPVSRVQGLVPCVMSTQCLLTNPEIFLLSLKKYICGGRSSAMRMKYGN